MEVFLILLVKFLVRWSNKVHQKQSVSYTLIILHTFFFIRLKSCNCTRIKIVFCSFLLYCCVVCGTFDTGFSVLLLPVTLQYNIKLFILAIFVQVYFLKHFCATFALKTKTCFLYCCRCYSCFTLRRCTTYNVFKNKYIFLIKMA